MQDLFCALSAIRNLVQNHEASFSCGFDIDIACAPQAINQTLIDFNILDLFQRDRAVRVREKGMSNN